MLKLLPSKQNLNDYKNGHGIWQLFFYFVSMNIVSMQAFHAQSKSIFTCLDNTSPFFFWFLISLKYFSLLKHFTPFPYLFLADSLLFYCPSCTLCLLFSLSIPSKWEIFPFCLQIHRWVRVRCAGRKTAKKTGPGCWQLPSGKRATLLLPFLLSCSAFQEQWEPKEGQSTTSTAWLWGSALSEGLDKDRQ